MVNTHTSARKTDSPRGRILPSPKLATVKYRAGARGRDFRNFMKNMILPISRRRTRERFLPREIFPAAPNIAQTHAGEIASLKRAGKLTNRHYVEASIFYADKRRKDTRKLTKKLLDREMYF